MKRIHSHVLLVLDKDTRKTIDRIHNRSYTITDRFARLAGLFTRGDFNKDTHQWEFTDVKDPQIARSRLLEDLALTSRGLKELLEIVDNFRKEVKNT